MKTKFTDKILMKFADGELKDKGMMMDIIAKTLEDTKEAQHVRNRLEIFTTTNTILRVLATKK